jgi:hypothetical protein
MAFKVLRRSVLCACVLALSCCLSASADVIFSDITGDPGSGYLVCSSGMGSPCPGGTGGFVDAAAAFTPTVNFTVGDAQVFVDAGPLQISGGPAGGSLDLSIWSDQDGLPGSTIEDLGGVYVQSAQYPTPPFPPSVLATAPISSAITLLAGTQYWLVLDASADYNAYIDWDTNGSPNAPTASLDCDSPIFCQGSLPPYSVPWVSSGLSNPQFEIDGVPTGTTVPEPSTFLLTTIVATLCLQGARCRGIGISVRAAREGSPVMDRTIQGVVW